MYVRIFIIGIIFYIINIYFNKFSFNTINIFSLNIFNNILTSYDYMYVKRMRGRYVNTFIIIISVICNDQISKTVDNNQLYIPLSITMLVLHRSPVLYSFIQITPHNYRVFPSSYEKPVFRENPTLALQDIRFMT